MKIRPLGAELFHADRRRSKRTDGRTERGTGVTKLIIAPRYFGNAPKMKTATKDL